jgi:hypothetical protein
MWRRYSSGERVTAATRTAELGIDGCELANRGELLGLVDKALGKSKPPAVEYLISNAYHGSKDVPLALRYFRGNPFGHAFVA